MAPVGPSMTQSKDPELQKESLNIVDEEPTTVMLNGMESSSENFLRYRSRRAIQKNQRKTTLLARLLVRRERLTRSPAPHWDGCARRGCETPFVFGKNATGLVRRAPSRAQPCSEPPKATTTTLVAPWISQAGSWPCRSRSVTRVHADLGGE
jgi:hypothetical protein